MKLNPPNAHRSQIKICEKRQTRNVQFRFMQNAFRILKPIQKSSKCVGVFRNTGANAFAKNQTRLAYEDKRDLYCNQRTLASSIITTIAILTRSVCIRPSTSHFSPFQIDTFLKHFDKMAAADHFGCPKFTFDRISGHFRSIWILNFDKMAAAILDVRKSLSITFLAISD